MGVNFLQYNVSIYGKDTTIKLIKQDSFTTDSVKIGGHSYTLDCPAEHRSLIKQAIKDVLASPFQDYEKFQRDFTTAIAKSNNLNRTISSIALTRLHMGVSKEIVKGSVGEKMDAYLKEAQERFFFSGSVFAMKDGDVILCKGYGMANKAEANTSHTVFQIASVSKQFTAAAILKLVEQGDMKLDDPIEKHLPAYLYSQKWKGITVHHLLCHRAGLANNDICPAFQEAKKASIDSKGIFEPSSEDLISYFKDMDLIAGVGEATKYSNFGYYLLGKIIEHRSGLSYGEFIKQQVLPPSMLSTGYYHDANQTKLIIAEGMHLNAELNGLERHNGAVAAEAYAAGGLYSTVEDLAHWSHALLSGEVVFADSLALMTKAYGTDDQEKQSFGYGLEVGVVAGRNAVFHGGTIDGYKAQLCSFVNDEKNDLERYADTIIILANNYDIPETTIRNSLAKILTGNGEILTESKASSFQIGSFNDPMNAEVPIHRFSQKEGKYFIEARGERNLLAPLSNGRYVNVKWGVEWEFGDNFVKAYGRSGALLGTLHRSS